MSATELNIDDDETVATGLTTEVGLDDDVTTVATETLDEKGDSDAELDAIAEVPADSKKKQKNPKFQAFFHTVNKQDDSGDTDEEFIAKTQSRLKDEWALRCTKGQTRRMGKGESEVSLPCYL